MTKVVYNACYGGFGLSEEAMMRYAEIKGIKLYVERDKWEFPTYWTVSPEDRIEGSYFYSKNTIYDGDLSRTDPVLVQVVEELGSEKASGTHAKLNIEDVPTGIRYHIHDYDGFESIRTPEDYCWETA